MSDDLKTRQPQDATKVDVHEAREIESWTKKRCVTKQKLIDPVSKVGTSAARATAHLGKG